VPEWGPLGSVRGALSNKRPYRDLRNVVPKYPFEISRRLPVIPKNWPPETFAGELRKTDIFAGDRESNGWSFRNRQGWHSPRSRRV